MQMHPSGTKIVNAYESYKLEIPDSAHPAFGMTGSFFYDLRCRMGASHRMLEKNPV